MYFLYFLIPFNIPSFNNFLSAIMQRPINPNVKPLDFHTICFPRIYFALFIFTRVFKLYKYEFYFIGIIS